MNHPNRGRHWRTLERAKLDTLGHLWSPAYPERTDFLGTVYAYPDGGRGASAAGVHGVKFTHWMPLPKPPKGEE